MRKIIQLATLEIALEAIKRDSKNKMIEVDLVEKASREVLGSEIRVTREKPNGSEEEVVTINTERMFVQFGPGYDRTASSYDFLVPLCNFARDYRKNKYKSNLRERKTKK